MSNEKMRAEFEAWLGAPTMLNRRESPARWGGTAEEITRHEANPYDHPWTRGAWEAWQASRAALVIELPERHGGFSRIEESRMFTGDVVKAIEAAGVRVKL